MMKRVLSLLLLVASIAAHADADQTHALSSRTVQGAVDENFLPTTLPGFELREMNQKRVVRFAVDSETVVEMAVPVLAYFPTEKAIPKEEMMELKAVTQELTAMSVALQSRQLELVVSRINRVLASMGDKRDTLGEGDVEPAKRVLSEKVIPSSGLPPAFPKPEESQTPIYVAPPTTQSQPTVAPSRPVEPLPAAPQQVFEAVPPTVNPLALAVEP